MGGHPYFHNESRRYDSLVCFTRCYTKSSLLERVYVSEYMYMCLSDGGFTGLVASKRTTCSFTKASCREFPSLCPRAVKKYGDLAHQLRSGHCICRGLGSAQITSEANTRRLVGSWSVRAEEQEILTAGVEATNLFQLHVSRRKSIGPGSLQVTRPEPLTPAREAGSTCLCKRGGQEYAWHDRILGWVAGWWSFCFVSPPLRLWCAAGKQARTRGKRLGTVHTCIYPAPGFDAYLHVLL